MYWKQITKTINKNDKNYNIISIDMFLNINVYLNGILQKKEDNYKIIDNSVYFSQNSLKNNDYINISYSTKNHSEQKIDENINIYEFNGNDEFIIDDYNGIINVYINGLLQNKNHYKIENNILFLNNLKNDDKIMIEIFNEED